MHIETGHNDQLEQLNKQYKHLCQRLMSQMKPSGDVIELPYIRSLYDKAEYQGKVYLVVDGSIAYRQGGKTMFHYDEGDLIGMEHQFTNELSVLGSDTYVELQGFDFKAFYDNVAIDHKMLHLWSQLLLCHNAVLAAFTGMANNEENPANLGFKRYQKGDVIIREGDPANEVYAIVEGHAEVFVNDTHVGEVLEEEIFGAMALFTNSPRSATVIATRPCMVLVVPRDQFMTLIQSHPRIGMNLIEHMARQIVSLNDQLLSAKDESEHGAA